tara:strand:+ start:709 stop:1269 length:561 start_codon:yes stop_codon:yes gene_type:complete
MIKLKDLLFERTMTESDFMKVLNAAKKETGAKVKIPPGTKKLCKEIIKQGFNKLDYKGKPGKKRNPTNLMYQYYAYVQGWGHTKFKSPADWFLKGSKFDPILKWIYENGKYSNPFDYDYLKYHVDSDMQANQIVGNIRPGEKGVEPAYYLVKDFWNSFGMSRSHRNYDVVTAKVQWWMDKNKVETL